MNQTVVYTAIIGKKDFLVNPTVVEPNVDNPGLPPASDNEETVNSPGEIG